MKYRNRHSIWMRTIALVAVCLFLVNNIAWAYPDRFHLACQSIFKPLQGKNIRDIGIIKYYISCIANVFPDFESIPGDVNANIGRESIDIVLEFSKKDELKHHFDGLKTNEYVIPCTINRTIYYAYVTLDTKKDIPDVTVFIEKEFESFKEARHIAHLKRKDREEEKISNEQEIDTPLSIAHGDKIDIKDLADTLKHYALLFFTDLGANNSFLEEAELFMQGNNIKLVPKTTSLIFTAGHKKYRIPIRIEKAHASNRHINIPRDTYGDLVQILIHELAAKCGLSHSFNEKLDKVYVEWRDRETMNLIEKHPHIAKVVAKMRFKSLKRVKERDWSKRKLSSGPTLFVDSDGHKVRKLTPIEEKVLNEALNELVFKEEDAVHVKHLSLEETQKLLGERNYDSMTLHGSLLAIHIIDDIVLSAKLKGEYKYLSRGLTAYASTTQKEQTQVKNIFILESIYNRLSSLIKHGSDESMKVVNFWRRIQKGEEIAPLPSEKEKASLEELLDVISIDVLLFKRRNSVEFINSLFTDKNLKTAPLHIDQRQYDHLWDIRDSLSVCNDEASIKVFNWIGTILADERINIHDRPDKSQAMEIAKGRLNEYLESFLRKHYEGRESSLAIDYEWFFLIEQVGNSFFDLVVKKIKDKGASSPLFKAILDNIGSSTRRYKDMEYAQKVLSNIVTSSIKFDMTPKINNSKEAWDYIFENEDNTRKFFKFASLLRRIYPFGMTEDDPRPPFRYALEEGITFKIGQNLYMTPITESYRRHIIFGKDKNGDIVFSFEVLIPGIIPERHRVFAQKRYTIANDILNYFPDKEYCARPLFYKELQHGTYEFYGQNIEFTQSCPLNVIAFEYKEDEDGKRLEHVSQGMLDNIAKELHMAREQLNLEIAEQIAELTAAVHVLGYIGHRYDGRGAPHSDFTTGNLRLIITREGVRVRYVDDFESYSRQSDYRYPDREIKQDYGNVVETAGRPETNLNNICKIPAEELYSIFREKFDEMERGRSKFNTKEKSKARVNTVEEKVKIATNGFAQALFNLGMSLQDGEKMLLALDEDLGREGTANLVRKLIKDMCEIKENKELQKVLQNLVIIKGQGKELAKIVSQYTSVGKDGIKIRKSDVIMVTKATNEEYCSDFKEEAIITFVDDAKLDMMDYYPFIEIALFTLAKALYHRGIVGYKRDKLMSLYKSLNIEQVAENQIIPVCIDNKIVKIVLRPAQPFEYDELQRIYRSIREFLQAA